MSASSPKPAPAFVLESLGCKVNQAEAAFLGWQLEASGWRRAQGDESAQLAVLMTCAVTGVAARQSRQAARRLARAHPGARVVITGCDVQAEAETYRREGFTVLGRAQLLELAERAAWDQWPDGEGPGRPDAGPWCPGVRPPGQGRSRALLKVQDGCDAGCAYCIVPHTRGRPRSLPLDDACRALAELGEAGSREVVLTGVHLGRYGRDLTPRRDLTELLRALLAAHPGPRLRLSSLEVNEITPELEELMVTEPRLCRHLHIPLQSGSDRVLSAMGRPYRAERFARTVSRLAQRIPGLCLGADVLVGLPGEDQDAFQETLELIRELPLSYLHVFPFSPRPGTRAAEMPGRPDPREARRRAEILRRLGREKLGAFYAGQVGRRLQAVVEEQARARSDNYCLVNLEGGHPPAGELVEVEVTGLLEEPGAPALLRGLVVS